MELNVEDFNKLIDERTSEDDRIELRRMIKIRRRKTVTLVEELSIRTQKVQPLNEEDGADLAADERNRTADRKIPGNPQRPKKTGPTSKKKCRT